MSVIWLVGTFIVAYLLTRVTEWWHTGTFEIPALPLILVGGATYLMFRSKK